MKRSYLITLGIIVAAAGAWVGRAAWRAHYDLVTLHVRNLPLADVVAQLERQTWETIITDSRLDANVTLNVHNLPLREVLDRLGEQAGALATVVHAVHRSPQSLPQLVAGLRTGDLSQAEGWTLLAPRLIPPVLDAEETLADSALPSAGHGKSVIIATRDTGPGGAVIRVRGADGGEAIHEEMISPERIVIETALESRAHATAPLAPDQGTALDVAREVQGRSVTFYALHQSAAATLGGGILRHFRSESSGARSASGSGRESEPSSGSPSLEAAEPAARRAQLSRYQNLTPEQRARRASVPPPRPDSEP